MAFLAAFRIDLQIFAHGLKNLNDTKNSCLPENLPSR
jgi:hypothetical protein